MSKTVVLYSDLYYPCCPARIAWDPSTAFVFVVSVFVFVHRSQPQITAADIPPFRFDKSFPPVAGLPSFPGPRVVIFAGPRPGLSARGLRGTEAAAVPELEVPAGDAASRAAPVPWNRRLVRSLCSWFFFLGNCFGCGPVRSFRERSGCLPLLHRGSFRLGGIL